MSFRLKKQAIKAFLLFSLSSVFAVDSPSKNQVENIALPGSSILYMDHSATNKLSAYLIESSTGLLTKLDYDVDTGYAPGDINSLAGKYLYVSNMSEPTISMYSVSSFKPTPLSPAKADTQLEAWNTAFDVAGKYAYTSNYQSNSISQFKVNESTGELVPLSIPAINSVVSTAGVGFNPLGTPYLYAASFAENKIAIYTADPASGQLTDTGQRVKTGSNPRGVWFDKHNHGYVLNTSDGTVSMYYANPTNHGLLEPLSPSTVKAGSSPVAFGMDNQQHYAYVAGLLTNKIYMYRIESSGVLVPLSPVSIDAGNGPRSIAVDKYNHLYASNIYDYTLSMYQINESTGQLAHLTPAKIKVDWSPFIISIVNH